MKVNSKIQWSDVKGIKFHHRVKRFYYKNLFRKIYTVAIIGLICANVFSLFKYQSFAQESERNTATLTTNADGSHTITYNGTSYTVAGYSSTSNNTYNWGATSSDQSVNAWGGTLDTEDNGFSPTVTNFTARRGPCDEGWHIPSRGEWNAIVISRCHLNTNNCGEDDLQHASDWTENNNLIYIEKSGLGTQFGQDFAMGINDYWSSSPDRSGFGLRGWILSMDANYIKPLHNYGQYNLIRCIKNSYSTPRIYDVTFNPQNGDSITIIEVLEGGKVSALSPSPTKEGYSLKGRYLTGVDSAFDFTGSVITGDITLYAKWVKTCPTGSSYSELVDGCAIGTVNQYGPVYYWTGEDGEGLISIKNPSGDTILTMMNKNLGATAVGQVGDLYQRGNNAPVGITLSSEKVEYKNYWPGHSFYDTIQRSNGGYDYWNNDMHYANLRGGLEDSSENNRGGINIGNTRQGPCPAGYHVPSAGEWGAVVSRYKNGSYLDDYFTVYFKLPYVDYIPDSHGELDWYAMNRSSSLSSYYVKCIGAGGRYSLSRDQICYPINKLPVRCFKDSSNAPETLTLTFDENGGSLLGATNGTLNQLVASGHKAQQPVNPTKDGLFFYKWTRDQAGKLIFDFSTPITNNATLYAQYSICNIEDGYIDDGNGVCVNATTITFNPNGGNIITGTIVVISGSTINLSNYIATKTDYEFIGWDDLSTSQVDLANDYVANKNVTLYAIYRKAPSSWTVESGDFEALNITSTGRTLFTIMDRNLGAEISGTGLTSYGSYYQWGNNYGFANSGTIQTSSDQVDASSYGPNNYFSNLTFITRSSAPFRRDTTDNTNLWGGTGDTTTDRGNGTDTDRRGPCPDGYHVPSTLEWKVAKDLWCESKGDDNLCIAENFVNDLSLPYAGYRGSDNGDIDNQGAGGFYWSSSSSSDNNAYYLNVSNMNPQQDERRAAGFSVRCFQNTSNKTIIYNTNGGNSLSNGTAVSRWMSGDVLPTPTHSDSHKEFRGWYTTSGFDNGSQVTTNALSPDSDGGSITLYAKWHDDRCAEGLEYDEELGICYEKGAKYLIVFLDYDETVLQSGYVEYREIPEYTGVINSRVNYDFAGWSPTIEIATTGATYIAQYKCSPGCGLSTSGTCITPGEMVEGEDFYTITVFDPTNPRSGLTIMDRNLGSFSGNSTSRFYYQWGNNFGFEYPGSLTVTGIQVDASEFGPGNYYNSSTYISNTAGRDSSNNNNLWGGELDNADNNWGANQTNPTDRRGPCPEGYHIPSEGEWGLLIKYWGDTTHSEYTSRGNGLYYVDGGSYGFMQYYQLNSHGFLYPNGNIESAGGGYGYYWSSSPKRILYRDPRTLEQGGNSSSFGFSVRCFSDTYEAPYVYTKISGYDCAGGYIEKGDKCIQPVKITYHPNGGAFSGMMIDEIITVTYDADYIPDINIQFPNKASVDTSVQSGWMFVGWYTDTTYSQEWTGYVDSGSKSQTVYARWLPFNDMTFTMSGVTFTIMDRNLGATEVYNQNFNSPNVGSMGFYYQWGNNYGFPNTGWNYLSPTKIDASEFGPGNYYNSPIFIEGTGNWSTVDNRNLWGGKYPLEPDNYRRGPCPKGYHVPLLDEWTSMFELWCQDYSLCWRYENPIKLASRFYLPFAGDYGYPYDSDYKIGAYWASDTSSSTNGNKYHLDHIDRGPSSSYRTAGLSIRCFKDSTPIKISYDIKGGETTFSNPMYIKRWWETPSTLSISSNTTRPNSIFEGWYTTPGFDEGTQVTTNDIPTEIDITLYGKWSCEDHYHLNGNQCEKDTFEIRFVNDDGSELQSSQVTYGEMPVYNGTTPEKSATAQYTYTFAGWSPSIQSVVGEATYTATYTSTVNKYRIRFVDEDGSELQSSQVLYGETPVYDGQTPEKPATAQYTYSFGGWSPSIQSVVGEATYTATYNSTVNKYEIKFVNEDGSEMQTSQVAYGEMPIYNGNLNKPNYVFVGWIPEIVTVTTGATYTARWALDINGNQIDDDLEPKYRVVVHYQYSRGGTITGDKTVNDLLSGLSYRIESPVIEYYKADKDVVSGIIAGDNIEITVIYRPNNDKNNNGIPDEEENLELQQTTKRSGEKPVRKSTKFPLSEAEVKESGIEQQNEERHGSATEQKKEEQKDNKLDYEYDNTKNYNVNYSRELNEAYQFSYDNKITNKSNIRNADVYGEITRIQMSKMLSNYAINVLGQMPDISRTIKFKDVPNELNYEYDNAVTKAYQLGIMGINMENNQFRPDDLVTRAEFATALSRMLYHTADGTGKSKYYEPHIAKLFDEGILTDMNPDQYEKRGYVMLMLMRSVK